MKLSWWGMKMCRGQNRTTFACELTETSSSEVLNPELSQTWLTSSGLCSSERGCEGLKWYIYECFNIYIDKNARSAHGHKQEHIHSDVSREKLHIVSKG